MAAIPAINPPSTTRFALVTKLASEPARKTIASAISFAAPPIPIGEPATIPVMVAPFDDSSSCLTMAVRMTPGLMLLILAPRPPRARVAACTRRKCPALATAYASAGVAAAFCSSSLLSSCAPGAAARCCVSGAGGVAPKWAS